MLRIAGFGGASLALHPKLLPDTAGVVSLNQKPTRGDLRPWKAPAQVATVGLARQSIYRMGRDVPSDANYWLSWPGIVDVVRGYNTAENGERTYYAGDGGPKWTDTAKALGASPPTAWRVLGLPAPATAPTLAAAGGSSTTLEDRFYVYTYVSDADEESAPSPVSAKITCKADATVTISSLAAAPAGSYGINRIRIYRTEATSAGGADFFYLREISSAASSTTDDGRALGEVCPSVDWLPAPGNPAGGAYNLTEPALFSLTALWNGMLAGISGRGVRFSEPFIPYAWPLKYELVPADVTPVALGTFGQTLVCLTNGRPVVITGGSPESMDEQPVDYLQACVSRRSVVSLGSGVAWASPDGLAFLGSSGARLLTANSLTRDDWQALNPASIVGAMYAGCYFGFYTVGGVQKGFMIDPANDAAIYFLDFGADAVYVDDLQSMMYLLQGTAIKKWDAGAALTATFRSKVFQAARSVPYRCVRVIADSWPVQIKVFGDGALRFSASVTSTDAFALPTAYRATDWQVEVSTAGAVQAVLLGYSKADLRGA